jgi:hypothetical protein
MLDMLFQGSTAWSKGWTRTQTDAAILNAALQAASGGEIPLGPYTGKPFRHRSRGRHGPCPGPSMVRRHGLQARKDPGAQATLNHL